MFTLLGLAVVQAATVCALAGIDAGERVGPIEAYRQALRRIRPLLGGLGVAAGFWVALTATAVLVPVAIWLAIRWSLLAQVVELEDRTAIGALGAAAGSCAGAGCEWPRSSASAAPWLSRPARSSVPC